MCSRYSNENASCDKTETQIFHIIYENLCCVENLYYVKNLLKLWEWAYYVSATHTNVVETMHLYVVATKDYMTFWSERFWMSCNLSSLLIIVNMSLKLPYRRFNKITRLEWVNNVFTKLIITTHFLKKIFKAYNIVFIFLIFLKTD